MIEDNKCEVCGKVFEKVHPDHLCSKKCKKIKEKKENIDENCEVIK